MNMISEACPHHPLVMLEARHVSLRLRASAATGANRLQSALTTQEV